MMEKKQLPIEPTVASEARGDRYGANTYEDSPVIPVVLAYRVRSQTWLIPTKLSA